jgi:ribose 5-phosphate isomerase A
VTLGARQAVAAPAAALVAQGMTVGLGSGSTMRFVIEELAARACDEGLRFAGVPTSEATAALARGLGLKVIRMNHPLDLAIDGADEVERGTWRLIKGLGGALLREKIVAESARRFVIVAGEDKLVDRLGTRSPVPVEVERFGHAVTARRLAALGARPALRLGVDGTPFVSDGGNYLLDCAFDAIDDLPALERALRAVAGVLGTGLFLTPVERVIVGAADGTVSVLGPPETLSGPDRSA